MAGGIGDGRVRVIDQLPKSKDESRESIGQTVERLETLRVQMQSVGGTLIIEHAPAEIKARVNAWGTFDTSGGLMQRIKTQLDSDCILSPGRFESATTPLSHSRPALARRSELGGI